MRPPRRRPLALPALAAAALALAACAPEASAGPAASDTPSASATAAAAPSATASPTPSPSTLPSTVPVTMPTDCRAILSESVLAELATTPLNDPATGVATGVRPDGSLVCLWRNPAADTTFLQTTISRMNRGPALDLLNGLAATGTLTCYTPSQGTRCDGTWPNPTYPVTDGRTLFWRQDVLIDTSYSNLAPSGYTDGIVAHLFAP